RVCISIVMRKRSLLCGSIDLDGGSIDLDGGSIDLDGGSIDLDGGSIDLDGGSIDLDGGSIDLDGGSIDFSAGSMPALKSVDHFIKVSAKYKMLLHPARPRICRSTFLYLADLTRL